MSATEACGKGLHFGFCIQAILNDRAASNAPLGSTMGLTVAHRPSSQAYSFIACSRYHGQLTRPVRIFHRKYFSKQTFIQCAQGPGTNTSHFRCRGA